MDIFVCLSNDNAARLVDVIAASEFEYAGVAAADLVAPDSAIQVGVPPYRVNLVTRLAGISFDSAWNRRAAGWLRETPAHFLARGDLIANKRAVAGPQDLVDLELIGSTPGPAATR